MVRLLKRLLDNMDIPDNSGISILTAEELRLIRLKLLNSIANQSLVTIAGKIKYASENIGTESIVFNAHNVNSNVISFLTKKLESLGYIVKTSRHDDQRDGSSSYNLIISWKQ